MKILINILKIKMTIKSKIFKIKKKYKIIIYLFSFFVKNYFLFINK